jgi:glycosyltransferase involved in cell wall biosynthesis
MTIDKKYILIAIPVYNEHEQLVKVLEQVVRFFSMSDVLVVNDGSTDTTEHIIQSYAVSTIKHKRNLGKGAAILSAIQYAKEKGYQWIILLDGDGQHAVREIDNFIREILKNHADVILGNRIVRIGRMPLHRVLSNGITSIIVSLCAGQQRIHDSQCGFRALRLNCLYPEKYRYYGFQFESEVLLRLGKAGCRFKEIPITTIYGNAKSKMKLLLDTIKFIILIVDCFTW